MVNLWKRYGQKLRNIIPVHFGLMGETETPHLYDFGILGRVHESPNQYKITRTPAVQASKTTSAPFKPVAVRQSAGKGGRHNGFTKKSPPIIDLWSHQDTSKIPENLKRKLENMIVENVEIWEIQHFENSGKDEHQKIRKIRRITS